MSPAASIAQARAAVVQAETALGEARRALDHAAAQLDQPDPADEFAGLPAVLKIEEVADLLQISDRSVRDQITAGTIPSFRLSNQLIRVRRSELVALMGGRAQQDLEGETQRKLEGLDLRRELQLESGR